MRDMTDIDDSRERIRRLCDRLERLSAGPTLEEWELQVRRHLRYELGPDADIDYAYGPPRIRREAYEQGMSAQRFAEVLCACYNENPPYRPPVAILVAAEPRSFWSRMRSWFRSIRSRKHE